MHRSLSEILKDADQAKKLKTLILLWNELVENKKKYALVKISFANEHIRELSLKAEGEDIEKGKFYYALKKMDEN
jgi:hypothetical protein